MNEIMKILITGGAGFIGSNFVNYWHKYHPNDQITVLDKLTYAGNLDNLAAVKNAINFIHGDIADAAVVDRAITGQDIVVHFAAETHVDRSINNPFVFTQSNVLGTHVLLEAARKHNIKRFHHISTDEVFGHIELDEQRKFNEHTHYEPRSPYSASKAGSDHLVRAYYETYKLPITISNCSNNFGPFMHPEKFFARSIIRLLTGKNIPIYTPGNQVRDWLHVLDHCRAIEAILLNGKIGETYTIGGMTKEISNLDAAKTIIRLMGLSDDRIEMVTDRPGHDAKYAVDWSKINRELGWAPQHSFEEWLADTIYWYQTNENWWRPLLEETENFYKSRGEQVLTPNSTTTVTPANISLNTEPVNTPAPIASQPTPQPNQNKITSPEYDYIIETAIPGVLIIERPTYSDDRGFFRETFRKAQIEQRIGTKIEFMQANHSHSSKGTLRGIHIAPWHKLVTVTSGEVQAVIVDTRAYSPTFGQHISVILNSKSPRSIFIPQGCGNSFLVLSDTADYTYLASDYWAPNMELAVKHDDPLLNIAWLNNSPTLSEKDQNNPTLDEVFPRNKL